MIEGSGSIPLTSGSGSGSRTRRPKTYGSGGSGSGFGSGSTTLLPPVVNEMQKGNTNNHISQISFMLLALIYRWEIFVVVPITYGVVGSVMLAAPNLIGDGG